MSNSNLRQVVNAPDVLLQELEGEAVLLNLANGQYYGLDETSYTMYQTLLSSNSVQAAYEHLCQVYAVEPEQLQADLDRFLQDLLEHGLLRYADEQSE